MNSSTVTTQPAVSSRRRFTPGEWMLLGVVALAVLHHLDHVLRADNSGWPFTPDVTPFTISLLVYPIFVLDFLLLRDRPWVRVGLVAVLFVALQVTHALVEPPTDQYGTWANGPAVAGRAGGAGAADPRGPHQPAPTRGKGAVTTTQPRPWSGYCAWSRTWASPAPAGAGRRPPATRQSS